MAGEHAGAVHPDAAGAVSAEGGGSLGAPRYEGDHAEPRGGDAGVIDDLAGFFGVSREAAKLADAGGWL